MPKRTNDFQSLIALLHRQLAAPDTTVSESGFIADPATGELREVDVLIEHTVVGYQARIAVECRDRSRAATVEWIDELIGKYQNTGIKVVAVSKRGFAKTAIQRAAKAGIETVAVTGAVERDWANWIASMPTVVIEMERLDLVSVDLMLPAELQGQDLPAPRPDSRLRLADDREWTTPVELYDSITQRERFSELSAVRPAAVDGKSHITIGLPPSAILELSNGRLVHPHGLRYHWRVTTERVEITLTPLRVGDLDVAMGTASGVDWKSHLVWSYAADRTPRSSISFVPGSSIGPGRTVIVGSNPIPPYRPSPFPPEAHSSNPSQTSRTLRKSTKKRK